MKCNMRKAREDKVTEAYQTIGKAVLAYLDASAGCVVADLYRFKRHRLQEMFDVTHNYLGYMMEVYGDGQDGQQVRAERALNKVREKLKEYARFEFDVVTQINPYDDVFGDTWHSESDKQKHASREQFIRDMELVVQTYHAQILHWFWLHKGFGKGRLTRLYTMLRDDYNRWVTEYLRCSTAGDAKAQEMLQKRQDTMQRAGMEFEEV